MPRAELKRILVEVRYSDGKTKKIEFDPVETEALFFSERMVKEALAPFYDLNPRKLSAEESIEFKETAGKSVTAITGQTVRDLWEVSVDDTPTGDKPIVILKGRKCIPHVACKRRCE